MDPPQGFYKPRSKEDPLSWTETPGKCQSTLVARGPVRVALTHPRDFSKWTYLGTGDEPLTFPGQTKVRAYDRSTRTPDVSLPTVRTPHHDVSDRTSRITKNRNLNT